MAPTSTPLRRFARTDISVTTRLLESLCQLAELTRRGRRLATLALHGDLIYQGVEQSNRPEFDVRTIQQLHKKLIALTPRSPQSEV